MKLAKVRHRIVSSILDVLIILGVNLIVFIGVWPGVIASIIQKEPLTLMMVFQFTRVFSIYAFILIVYYIVIPTIFKGQTVGKMVFKLKVVTDDNKDVDYKVLFFREGVCRILVNNLSLGISEIVACVMMFVRDDNKTFADIFARTKVIDLKEED